MNKKSVLIGIMLLGIAIHSAAQLKVFNNGNVGIDAGITAPASTLAVGTAATQKATEITASNQVLSVKRNGNALINNWNYAIISDNVFETTVPFYVAAVRGMSISNTPLSRSRAWGLYGEAGNATSGYNYGVMGVLHGTNNGAGVVGTVNGFTDVNVQGKYAGYFVGDVKITGTLLAYATQGSDIRYKQNIVDLGSFFVTQNGRSNSGILQSVLAMNPVQYNLRQMYTSSAGDTASIQTAMYDENSQIFKNKHYGLIAQELQELYPDLVYKGDDGYLSVDYIGIIPLLIQSVKELKAEIDNIRGIDNNSTVRAGVPAAPLGIADNFSVSEATLFQNTPNPFSQATEIRYFMPQTVNNAMLCIYDLNGKQLKQILITERGAGSQTIQGSEFSAGIYLYALIADGQEVDVKRMILTE